ncbi:suppressor of fused domain protein [Micromonospora sp. NBC_01796]|nr:suppressor of fused domain protein [Micromonospora sp. NBC_01796]WSA86685.1 suppressor of fused domain protein [Micromonospora sp. NBC_01796]
MLDSIGSPDSATATVEPVEVIARADASFTLRYQACSDLSMTSEAPGWGAIDARLAELYPDVEPKHYGTLHRFALGGPEPLDDVSFYHRVEPVPHWHIIGYGMSELYAKETDNPDESGWGFELTIRITRDTSDTAPPTWAANLLQNLARYVISSGTWFEPGHHINANGPIRQDHDTALTALTFVEDPELGTIPPRTDECSSCRWSA